LKKAMPDRPTFLLLGSNSFSGASFADFLAHRGHDVLATSRSPEPSPAFLPYAWHDHAARVRFHRIDLNHDLDALEALLRREKPSHVVNFAAQSMVAESWANPHHWMMTNVVSTVRLHERLRQLDFVERYVHVTTPEVYGSTEGWVKEDAPFNPSTPYAVSRAAADMSLRTYLARYRFPVLFTRAANVYGPGQRPYRIIPRTILSALFGRTLHLHGGGVSLRSFIHIGDVAEATYAVALRGQVGETYHISTDRLVSIRALVELILSGLNIEFAKAVDVAPERPGRDFAYRLDSSKLRSELGWSDRISLEQGIEQTVAWAVRFKDELARLPWDYEHRP
jgi:dTDP-glucose 4,6-dehydratase